MFGGRQEDGAQLGRGNAPGRRPSPGFRPVGEGLEPRLTPSVTAMAAAAVVMSSASTADSQGVTVSYEVAPSAAGEPLTIGIYRSADSRFDAADVPVATATDVPSSSGSHELTIPIAGGLTPNPEHPYVLAVANPSVTLASGSASAVASFRVYTIGVVTHGGIEDPAWKNGPAWELVMARSLLNEGYDAVIPFNWVDRSNTPGDAAKQAPRLVRQILAEASQFPAGAPVDLQFIGHSEGTVVNSVAAEILATELPANLGAGFVTMTMLDPHAANPDVPGQQYSVTGGPLGWITKLTIDTYQAYAHDPPVTVPSLVDEAQVFYQHTNVKHAGSGSLYNIWGQVPVHGAAYYYNLTLDGVIHSGKTGVYAWYQRNIVPLLGDGEPEVLQSALTGAVENASAGGVVHEPTPTYTGHAQPGATVRLYAGPAADPSVLVPVGHATADLEGTWSVTTRPLAGGRYRVMATAMPPRAGATQRLAMVPTAPLGILIVSGTRP